MEDDNEQTAPRDLREVLVDIGRALNAEGEKLSPELQAIMGQMRFAVRSLDQERASTEGRIRAIERQTVADGRGVIAIMPRTPQEAYTYAGSLCDVGHVPSAYRTGGKKDGVPILGLVALGIMKSMEVGLPPQTGLGNIMPINDRFTIWGDGAQALVMQSGTVAGYGKEFVLPEGFTRDIPLSKDWPDDVGVRVWFKRKGVEGMFEHTYTVGDAKRSNLWMNVNKKPWITDPWRMLFNRARAFALRDGFADCLLGLAIREEVEDYMDTPRDAVRHQVDSKARLGGFGSDQPALEHQPIVDAQIPTAEKVAEPVVAGEAT